MGGFTVTHLLILLAVVVLVFGTSRLRNVGKDVGEAVKGFKKGMADDNRPPGQLGDDTRREAEREDAQRRDDNVPR